MVAMDTKLKWGLGIVGGWLGLVLLSKAAKPATPVIGPDPDTKPKPLPDPKVVPPTPSDGKTVPGSSVQTGFLKELSPANKSAVWKVFDQHDYIATARPDIVRLNSDLTAPGAGNLNPRIAILNTSPSTYVLISTDGVLDAMVWFAQTSDLAALDRDPKNIWTVFLKPNEYASVRDYTAKVDPSTFPSDIAVNYAKTLADLTKAVKA